LASNFISLRSLRDSSQADIALIAKFRNANPDFVLSHPGPDDLRAKRVRKIVIVTDFLGSSKRVYEMLDAFARVASTQSWRSWGLVAFDVVSYSEAQHGVNFVAGHRVQTKMTIYAACPVVSMRASKTLSSNPSSNYVRNIPSGRNGRWGLTPSAR
jgi:hypothetical protein